MRQQHPHDVRHHEMRGHHRHPRATECRSPGRAGSRIDQHGTIRAVHGETVDVQHRRGAAPAEQGGS
jgi:hypothetical protein